MPPLIQWKEPIKTYQVWTPTDITDVGSSFWKATVSWGQSLEINQGSQFNGQKQR